MRAMTVRLANIQPKRVLLRAMTVRLANIQKFLPKHC
jgi:hypothetical protein